MYDGLTACYTFPCPTREQVQVSLSDFRRVERLPGALHPAVFRVTFACACEEEHEGLVTHGELDWAQLGGAEASFLNLMTSRLESATFELLDLAARKIQAGEWPWSFFCYPEERPRPVFPSAFQVLAPADESVGVAVRCPSCSRTTVNVVSRPHVDVPFYNDRRIGVVEHLFTQDHQTALAAFCEELQGSSFEARRRELAA